MEYLVDGTVYGFSYTDLREDYKNFISMSDEKFFSNIPAVLHFVCIVCYIKETPAHLLLNDEGLIHQLVHLLDKDTKDSPVVANPDVKSRIRDDFEKICCLA